HVAAASQHVRPFEELSRLTREEFSLRADVDVHHPVAAAIKQFTAAGAPEGLVAAIARDLPSAARAGIGLYVNLAAPGFLRRIRHPAAVRRELRRTVG